jgi:hypothetical protein
VRRRSRPGWLARGIRRAPLPRHLASARDLGSRRAGSGASHFGGGADVGRSDRRGSLSSPMCALASSSITICGDANAVVRFVHHLGTTPLCRPTPAAPSSDHLAINEIRAPARVGLHVLAQPSGTARGRQRWEAMGDLFNAFLVPSPGFHGRARMYELGRLLRCAIYTTRKKPTCSALMSDK